MEKPRIKCSDPMVLPTPIGYFVGLTLEEDHHSNKELYKGRQVRSSRLLRADFELGVYETLNTIYVDIGKGGCTCA